MGVEIERKFLVLGTDWQRAGKRSLLRQGYISSHPERLVRVRIDDAAAYLTIKGKTTGATRAEWEYPIPPADARSLLETLCEKPLIEKYRYRISHEGMTWEVDEFLGENAGLVVAEIELSDEDEFFVKPSWIGEEVTSDPRYFNSSLLKHPFSQWK
ncbi:CYTH domain-containing protein [Oxalobacteraceae bacterium R-40]|uniref:CYTH domain-containing protein n=1 Tax=Keguizhuia sedimenti TaxID=3064264 RepID=A0ABU1BPY9_9BURK|nr:CYTH domain-containing protein [Oxalobacteraceae bacterium R-40]